MAGVLAIKSRKKKSHADTLEVRLSGSIDENAARPLATLQKRSETRFDFDFSKVDFVNSSGIREWMRFLVFAAQGGRKITVAGARPNFVAALMNLPTLRDGVEVRSIYRSFTCPQRHRIEVLTPSSHLKGHARSDAAVCPQCGEGALADDDGEDYSILNLDIGADVSQGHSGS